MNDAKKGESQHRPITAKERALIDWLLRHGHPGSGQFLEQLDSLVVVWKCSCGCPTVNFAREGKPAPQEAEHILEENDADVLSIHSGQIIGKEEEVVSARLRFTLKLVPTSLVVFLRSKPFIHTKSWLNAKESETL